MEYIFGLCESMYNNKKEDSNTEYLQYNPVCLEQGGGYYSQAVVGYKYSRADYYPYVVAYTECAKYLYSQICNDASQKHNLFIPTCYLYRNTVELSLKRILFEQSSYDYKNSIKHLCKKKHKVLSLWNLIKPDVVRHSGASKPDATLINAEKYIQQISDIDGRADKFRYPVDISFHLHFEKKRRLDIDNVYKFLEDIVYFLDCVDMQMSANNEIQAEIEAEYRSEMEQNYGDYY